MLFRLNCIFVIFLSNYKQGNNEMIGEMEE